MCVPFGITVFPSTLMDEERIAAKVSPAWFLLLASAWPTVALIVVPCGTVTNVVGGVTLLETPLLDTLTGLVAPFGATTLPASGFLAAGLAPGGLPAGCFASACFSAWAGGCVPALAVAR